MTEQPEDLTATSAEDRIASARSALFVPGDRPDRFDKAAASGADLVIIDLEDGVAEEQKALAREQTVQWLAEGGQAAVRLNADTSPHYDDDWTALLGSPGLQAVVVPMAEDPLSLDALARDLEGGVPIIAIVETAQGVLRARAMADIDGVTRLAFGHLDLAANLDSDPGRTAMLLSRSSLVLASRAAGIAGPLEGVTTALDDPQLCADDARYARQLGFTGKLAIHPRQVEPINTAFSPTSEDVDWATRVVQAAGEGGAVRVEGEMVDGPVIARARQILARAER